MLIGLIAGAGLIVTGTGAVWGTTAAAASGRLARNEWAGIRIRSTRASDAAWLAGHQAALPLSRDVGIASLILGVAMMVNGVVNRDGGWVPFWILFTLGYGGLFIATIVSAIRAHRAALAAEK